MRKPLINVINAKGKFNKKTSNSFTYCMNFDGYLMHKVSYKAQMMDLCDLYNTLFIANMR